MTHLRLSWANTLRPALGATGIDPVELGGDLLERARQARRKVAESAGPGVPGFRDLPGDRAALAAVKEQARLLRPGTRHLVVVGIGGSSLGTEALLSALAPGVLRGSSPPVPDGIRIHVLDNPDPHSARALLDELELEHTVVNVVSKSGGTAETLAGFLVLEEALARALDPEGGTPSRWRDRLLFTTDPEDGLLRRIARRYGVATLPIPPAVGGRFSVLSAVGLFPAAMAGLDPERILSGARQVLEAHDEAGPPASTLALLLHRLHEAPAGQPARPIHVVMPYGDRLRRLALWVQQLWAESLGKRDRVEGKGTGPTPLAAAGAADQHSLLQLFMEGPDDKVVVFVSADDAGPDLVIPSRYPEEEMAAKLAGHGLGELLEVERRATAEALRRAGRPSLHLALEAVDEASVGAFFMLWQLATLHAAAHYGVDPMGQPGVELGKRLTGGLLAGAAGPSPDVLRPEDTGGATWPDP
ncbi:MAG: glucose-6-phosphate isomerase [Gemmatimonadales bacterium]|nr:MAG: glucose-6-phosphate isomerase [Gemmatimonadales bacterium]